MRRALVGGALAVAVAAAAVVFLAWPRGASEVSTEDAVADFRARAADADGSGDEDGSLPEAGVYTYDLAGDESAKLGPLPAEDRSLPDTATVVVVSDGDGCATLTLNLIEQHTEDTRWCRDGEALVLDAHTKHLELGALSPTASLTCDPDVLVDPDVEQTSLACTLVLDGGPASVEAEVTGTASRGAPTRTEVDGEAVEAIPLELRYELSGDLSGTWSEVLLLDAATALPLEVTRDLDLSGLATFREHSELALRSLAPAG